VLATYPQVSEALGKAIVSVMLGQTDPKSALDQAATQADAALAQGG
jgi:multiple sugar transport system substrate-binding protein